MFLNCFLLNLVSFINTCLLLNCLNPSSLASHPLTWMRLYEKVGYLVKSRLNKIELKINQNLLFTETNVKTIM